MFGSDGSNLEQKAWDGDYWRRGFTDEGDIVGTKDAEFGKYSLTHNRGRYRPVLEQMSKIIEQWIVRLNRRRLILDYACSILALKPIRIVRILLQVTILDVRRMVLFLPSEWVGYFGFNQVGAGG